MDAVDVVVVGAGVVGLAVAKRLADAGREVIVLESEEIFGSGTSSRNSEVIHAGIYYPKGSLKAELCVEGKARLYRYLEERDIPFRRCGKFIVATSRPQLDTLEAIRLKALANGVTDLEYRTAAEVRKAEPEVVCEAALFSPSTGIIDSHAYMQSLVGDISNNNGALFTNTAFLRADVLNDGFVVHTLANGQEYSLKCRTLINSAGLHAHEVAAGINGLNPSVVPKIHFAKGSYFTITRRPFGRLIYPVPEPGGLGVHVTLDLGGGVKFGPDVEWVSDINYEVDLARANGFYEAIRRYYPSLEDGALQPGYAGIRTKRSAKGEPDSDFLISGPAVHGITNLVNLFAIESPGLTSSMAIAERVAIELGL